VNSDFWRWLRVTSFGWGRHQTTSRLPKWSKFFERLSAPWLAKWTLRWGRAVLHLRCSKGAAFCHQLLSFRFWRQSLELIGRFCLNHGKIPGLMTSLQKKQLPQSTSVHSEAYLRPAATAACIPRVPWKWIHSLLGCWTWFIENDLK